MFPTHGQARFPRGFLLALAWAACARGGDFDDWQWRMPLVFTGYPDVTLTDFPALVRLPPEVAAAALDGGADLRFADADDRVFDYDIDTWGKEGTSLAWVRVPRLAANTPAFAYWGNPRAWPQNQEDTWAGSHVGVWHLNAAQGILRNAARNRLHARPNGQAHAAPGVAGGGFSLSGGFLYVHEDPALNLQETFTLSGWFKLADGTHPLVPRPLFSHKIGPSQEGWDVTTGIGAFDSILIRGNRGSGGGVAMPEDMTFMAGPRAWRHITVQYNGPNRATLYVDGEKAGETHLGGGKASDIMGHFHVGASAQGGSPWRGWVDEIRLENAVRHESWVRASYETVMDPRFVEYGEPGPNEDYKILTVAATRVGETNATVVTVQPARAKAAVTLHWGTVDGGADPAAWQHAAPATEPVVALSGLARGTRYFARAEADGEWSPASVGFATLPAPAPLLGRMDAVSKPSTNLLVNVRVKQLPPNPVLTLECGGKKQTLTPVVGGNLFEVPGLARNTPHPCVATLSGETGAASTGAVLHASHTSRWLNEGSFEHGATPTNQWRSTARWTNDAVPDGVGDTAHFNWAYGRVEIDTNGVDTLTVGAIDFFNLFWKPVEIVTTNNTRIVLDNGVEPARVTFYGTPANHSIHAPLLFKSPAHIAGESASLTFGGGLGGPGPVFFEAGQVNLFSPAETTRRVTVPIAGSARAYVHKYGPGDLVVEGGAHSFAIAGDNPRSIFVGRGGFVLDGAAVTNLNNVTGSLLFGTPDGRIALTNSALLHCQFPSTLYYNASNTTVNVHHSTLRLPGLILNAENNALLVEDGGVVEMLHGDIWGAGANSLVALRGTDPGRVSRIDLRGRAIDLRGANNHLLVKSGAVVTNGSVIARSGGPHITVDGGELHARELSLVAGTRLNIRATPAPRVVVAGDVDFRPGVTLAPLNPEKRAGVFPLLVARRIFGLPRLDETGAPGATLSVNNEQTTLFVTFPDEAAP